MRTTVRLDDQLLADAKAHAARTGQTLTSIIEDALRLVLARHNHHAPRENVELKTVGGSGVQPGVDLDDSAGLLDLVEHR